MGDMGRSLGLVLAVVLLLLLVGPARTLLFPGDNRQPAVDYRDQVTGFGQVAHTPALVPARLPSQWRANGADLTLSKQHGAHLHIGWGLPDDRYAGLDETDGDPATLLQQVLGHRGLAVTGTREVGGAQWQVRRSQRGETALTRTAGAVTVVVTGSASEAQLDLLAASLH
ncbi:MAG TPA: DUF4245 domain-containing protein [Mycobacteriales bacterium]|nr:DUF4245 domain-containing protein [Mycobacteriales bacterium]